MASDPLDLGLYELAPVKKVVQTFDDDGTISYSGIMFRRALPEEKLLGQVTAGGYVRIWGLNGLYSDRYFDSEHDATAWANKPLECWVEPDFPGEEPQWRTVVREPRALFATLRPQELLAVEAALAFAVDRGVGDEHLLLAQVLDQRAKKEIDDRADRVVQVTAANQSHPAAS